VSVLSANVVAKAARLHEQGRVVPLGAVRYDDDGQELPAGRTQVFEVRGDRGTYAVMLGQRVSCTCAAHGSCSHIAAALLLGLREQRTPAPRPARHRRSPFVIQPEAPQR
jgi:uncharacterized Zn finger protein